ncbi:hypothetical protein Droror1_Dr00001076 [Drosera rotundifolia]
MNRVLRLFVLALYWNRQLTKFSKLAKAWLIKSPLVLLITCIGQILFWGKKNADKISFVGGHFVVGGADACFVNTVAIERKETYLYNHVKYRKLMYNINFSNV